MKDLDQRVAAAANWLETHQNEQGYWAGNLETNSCMEAEWVLAMHVLGIDDDPKTPRVVQAILDCQRPDGSWDVYLEADTGDVNTTVECYAALRASGHAPDSPPLAAARRWILDHDGMNHLRNFTKYWLALIGEWPWKHTPSLPPEIILLPAWAPFNIYQFAAWARGTMVPLTVLHARQTCRPLPADRRLDELFPNGRAQHDFRLPRHRSWFSGDGLFHLIDRVLSQYVHSPIQPARETAIRVCLEWILKHQDADGAWSGIQPPWIYSLMALHQEGYPLDHPALKAGLEAFDLHWSFERQGATFLQASESPVWDTGLTLHGLLDAQRHAPDHPVLTQAASWLLDRQATGDGDWKVNAPGLKGGGWAFQRANRRYPDIDDTAVVLHALHRIRSQLANLGPDTTPSPVAVAVANRADTAIELATNWLLGLQSSSGGWAAYDRDNNKRWVTRIPFGDFGELIDPPSADVTAHVVEALVALGPQHAPAVRRAVAFLRSEQEPDGSWFGRWGVNYICGTGNVLPALRAAGVDMSEAWVQHAARWLLDHQNSDGGWGETCASYIDESQRGRGPSTASQTAWALMGLLAFPTHEYDPAIQRGVAFLLSRQHPSGTWVEPEYTGTGFPGYGVGARIDPRRIAKRIRQTTALQRGFMINYNLYRHYFPLMALARASRHFQPVQAPVVAEPRHHTSSSVEPAVME